MNMSSSEKHAKRPLHIMKFGGTSVGDARCIGQVAEIVCEHSVQNDLVVVVSAMSGVTNQLIEAARRSAAGDPASAVAIFARIRDQHNAAMKVLIRSEDQKDEIAKKIRACCDEGERLCEEISTMRELSAKTMDSISSLGERLSAPLLAGALMERGLKSASLEATELIVTNCSHGNADPLMEPTRVRCEHRLRPMLLHGIVPIVTGFIGATPDGALTTLGRGGSDYSATILGAALGAHEVVIWTDVDGLMTADPRIVEDAATIFEISYREAAELAHFGAKVLHPKTVRALRQCGVPLWIRNTFAREHPGTRITPAGPTDNSHVKGLTATCDVTMLTISNVGLAGDAAILPFVSAAVAEIQPNVVVFWQTRSRNDLRVTVSSADATAVVEALRRKLGQDAANTGVEISEDATTAVVTMVGKNLHGNGVAARTCNALQQDGVNLIAMAQTPGSECNLSLAVSKREVNSSVNSIHREFRLGLRHWDAASSSKNTQPDNSKSQSATVD
jgi:bifunctional aspartokinase / homoserine dehydrogenase 1